MTDQQKANHWVKQIDNYLENTRRPNLPSTLKGIRSTIKQTGRVTDRQIQAIKNIRWGKMDENTTYKTGTD